MTRPWRRTSLPGPPGAPQRDRALARQQGSDETPIRSPPNMPRLRVPRKAALFLAVVVAALTVLPGAAMASSASPAGAAQTAAAHGTAGGQAVAASPGGLCGVPGIGDIGGLVGLCTLGQAGLGGDLNSICSPSLPDPEPANSGIDALIAPPDTGRQPDTLYRELGVNGDFWAATDLQCS